MKRGLEANSSSKTTASVKWSHRGRASTTVSEEGDYSEVLGRSNQDDITSPICLSGFVISLKNDAGHRIYWRGRKTAYELPANEDSGLDALIKLGFVVLGYIYYI